MPKMFLLVVLLIFSTPVLAQTGGTTTQLSGSGQPVDPSKNVLDALLAAVTRLNDLMSAGTRRADDLREIDNKYHSAQLAAETRHTADIRDAETRRVDQLVAQKQAFDLELARIIKSGVDGSSLLLAAQVKEFKIDSDVRTSKLEQFANEQRGRASGGNEVWTLIITLSGLLLVSVGIIISILAKGGPRSHEHGDAERYRQYIDRKVFENGKKAS